MPSRTPTTIKITTSCTKGINYLPVFETGAFGAVPGYVCYVAPMCGSSSPPREYIYTRPCDDASVCKEIMTTIKMVAGITLLSKDDLN
jgi:hypothetical protein